LPAVLLISVPARRPTEHCDRRTDFDRVVKRNRQLIWHSHTTMRRGISRQIAGVHPVGAVKPHEPRHWRRNKFAAARNSHVHVGIGDHGASIRVDDLAVNARMMAGLLLDHFERAGFSEMPITSARNRRSHDNAPASNQIRSLLAQIDFNPCRVFGLRGRKRRRQT